MSSEGVANNPRRNPTIVLQSSYVDEEILRYVPSSHTKLGVRAAQIINKLKMGYRGLWKDTESTCLFYSNRTFLYKQEEKYFCTFMSVMDPFTLFTELNESEYKKKHDKFLEELKIIPIKDVEGIERNSEGQVKNDFQHLKEIYKNNNLFQFKFDQFSLKYNKAYIILKKGVTDNSEFEILSEIFIVYPLYENKCSIMLSEHIIEPRSIGNKALIEDEMKRKVTIFEEIDKDHKGELSAEHLTSLNPDGLMNELQIPRSSSINKLKRLSTVRKKSMEQNSARSNNDDSDEIKIKDYMGPFDSSYPGNGEVLTPQQRIDVLFRMLENGEHVLEAIRHKHRLTITKGKNIIVESNEINGHFAFRKDYERHPKGGLLYINAPLIVEQKKVIAFLLKKISSNIFTGKGLMNVSLPVTIFEPRSFLERFARSLGYAPDYLERAGTCPDPIERMKLVISFFMGAMICCINQEKPFNPVLGETLQARINGNLLYLEQVSHHPPQTNYLMIGKNYKLYGTHLPLVHLSANTLTAEQDGTPIIEFPGFQTKLKLKWPKFVIHGTSFGTRIFNFITKAIVYDYKNRLYGEINYNCQNTGMFSNKPIDIIGGGIYSVDPTAILRLEGEKKHFGFNLKSQEINQKICSLEGVWDDHIKFDDETYWSLEHNKPFLLEYEPHPLPSDCSFRDDVLMMRSGRNEEAQSKKEEIEILQRTDKKLRESSNKK